MTKSRAVGNVNKWWGDSQKMEAVKTYLMIGTVQGAARLLKIPEQTMYHWSRQPWWIEAIAEFKLQDQLILSARLKKIVEKSFDVVEDRLENGDFVYDQKTGAMRRKPVAMRDAHKVAIDLDNKRTVLLDRAVPTASEEAIDDKLTKLAQKFADIVRGNGEIVNGKKPQEDVIDVEAKEFEMAQDDGIPDEVFAGNWEEGPDGVLQESQTTQS